MFQLFIAHINVSASFVFLVYVEISPILLSLVKFLSCGFLSCVNDYIPGSCYYSDFYQIGENLYKVVL